MQVAQAALACEVAQQRARFGEVAEGRFAGDFDAGGELRRLGLCPCGGTHFARLAVDLHHFRLDVRGDQLARRALRDEAAAVHDGESVAEALRLVHEMRRQQHRLALLQQLLQSLPDEVARLRVEAGGRLVEDEQVGVVHQRARQGEAPLHAARQCADLRLGAAGQAGEVEQMRDARAHRALGQAEVAAIHQQVFRRREVRVEVVHLRHDADAHARLARAARHRQARQADLARVRRGQAESAAQGRRLAGAVGPQQSVAFPGAQLESQPLQHGDAVVGFAQPGDAQGFHCASMMRRMRCSLRWKKWSAPGITVIGRSCGSAQASTLASGTVSSCAPWMTMLSAGTAAVS